MWKFKVGYVAGQALDTPRLLKSRLMSDASSSSNNFSIDSGDNRKH